jgi:hypothetical protein
MSEREFREGQRVWYRGRAATFLYYARESGAVIRLEGHAQTTVVRKSSLSSSPRRSSGESQAEAV